MKQTTRPDESRAAPGERRGSLLRLVLAGAIIGGLIALAYSFFRRLNQPPR
jgi:hypothetical protein